MLDHTIVHGVFVGPARSGKNSLMERLLGRMPSSVSPSTGVAESVVQVKVIQKSATFAANVEESIWSVMDYDDEAIKLMLINSQSQNNGEIPIPQTEEPEDTGNSEASSSESPNTDLSKGIDTLGTDSESEDEAQSNLAENPALPDSYVPPIEILKNAVRNKGYEALKQHFETTWSLYLTNTGGQMEFQEVLPLLVSGPSMFFFTFRLDRDLHEYYTIEYELSDGKCSYPYTSTLSTVDGMLQTLASISAMGTFVYSGLHKRDKPLRPKVFFVGTHKDQLDSENADRLIASVDKQLQKNIRSTAYYDGLVQFASKSQLIFTSPTHWLIFSLAIRKLNDRVISYDLCLEIARQCGLADDELDEALHFIHSKMGLIRYFPYEHTKNVVFIDSQFLFDKVTELIVSTFTFEKVDQCEMEQFEQKGIFSLEKFDEVSSHCHSSTIMSTFQFGKLLERLRIVAPLKVANEMKYFLPCVLAHARESDSKILTYDTPVPTLLVSFECGYIPKGVPGALIKYLMANEMKSLIKWNLLTDKIYKNEVTFCVGPYDTFRIMILPTHFEITCIPDPQFTDEERDDRPIKESCADVLEAIDSGINEILKDLNYIETQHCITFPCQADGCSGGHPAQLNWCGGFPLTLQCNSVRKRSKLPINVQFWKPALQTLNEKQHKDLKVSSSPLPTKKPCLEKGALSESHTASRQHTRLDRNHHASLLQQLTEDASNWREIGTHLGFRSGELDNIQSSPLLLSNAPTSWLSAMLSQWLQWAPGDSRGSNSFAILKDLKTALNQAGLGATAHDLKV